MSRHASAALIIAAAIAACASGEEYAGDVTPATLAVVSAPSSITPGAKADTITIQVRGAVGQPAPGHAVVWATTAAHATLRAIDSISDSDGYARALFTPGPRLGLQRVSASVGTLATLTIDINATSGVWKIVAGDCGVAHDGVLACFPRIAGARTATRVGTDRYLSIAYAAYGGYCASRVGGGVDCFSPLSLPTPSLQQLAGAPSAPLASLVGTTSGAFCGLTTDGEAWCWGDNRGGILGNGSEVALPTPALVSALLQFDQVVLSEDHGCGLVAGGAVHCWGNNNTAQLGAPSDNVRARLPQPVNGLPPSTAIAANGLGTTCALGVDRVVRCWGLDYFGHLGRDQAGGPVLHDHIPAPIAEVGPARALTGTFHGFAVIDIAGQAFFWGEGDGWGVYRPTMIVSPSATGFITQGDYYKACQTQSGNAGIVCLDTGNAVREFLPNRNAPPDYSRLFYGLPPSP